MATTTPNFGWDIPQSTDLVKDGATAIAALGTDIDTAFVDLKGGTTGQVLSKASNTDLDFTWVAQDDSNAIQNAIVDAKGDLISATAADTPARLAVGTNGQVLTADSTTATGLKWSTPATATTWTQRLATQANAFKKVEYNGSNLYVAAGDNGSLYTSPDGITWTSRTSGFGANSIYSVAYGNGLWVAVGTNGTLTTSSDGITWTARTANVGTSSLNAVTYANSLWVAVGQDGGATNTGGITYSTDGLTWTRKNQSITIGTTYNDVIWNGTNWIVVAQSNTNNYLYASTPSGTWTAGATGSAGDIFRIIWDGTRHITYEGASKSAYYSTSTTLGTTTVIQSAHRTNAGSGDTGNWYFYNNKIYISNGPYLATTTPASSANVEQSSPQMFPVRMISTTPYLNAATSQAIFAGSAGLIYAGAMGIYTSF